jgi:L-rhamnose-H+ transport protein
MNELLAATANPALGIVIFMLGGLAGAVFYLPFKKVTKWAWESYWLVYALFGLLIIPWILAFTKSPNVLGVLKAAPNKELWYCYLCGAAWGFGGLTWGLMIRYLGVGLGLAIGCGLVASVGTLVPKALKGEFAQLFEPGAGITSFVGIVVALVGIVLVGLAGMSKEGELSEEEKKKAVAEFNFKRGILVALFSGIMSGAMGIGLQSGAAIEQLALTTDPVTQNTWRGMPVLVVVLLGGFTVNFIWCILLNIKNRSASDYIRQDGPALLANFVFAGLAGLVWCSQFICFKTGEPAMGDQAYVGWQVLMASAILFSTLLGIFLGEWKGTSAKTRSLLAVGLILLVLSSVVAGYSGYLGQKKPAEQGQSACVSQTHRALAING